MGVPLLTNLLGNRFYVLFFIFVLFIYFYLWLFGCLAASHFLFVSLENMTSERNLNWVF